VKVAVDSSGEPMTRALAARPDLIKPNRVELAEAVGHDLPTVGAVIDAARDSSRRGIGCVLVSLGRDGALLVDSERVVRAEARVENPLSTVGAGDAFLAGYLHASRPGSTPRRPSVQPWPSAPQP
jgi:1-phosphofructokinase